jgi:hypothetical protein
MGDASAGVPGSEIHRLGPSRRPSATATPHTQGATWNRLQL